MTKMKEAAKESRKLVPVQLMVPPEQRNRWKEQAAQFFSDGILNHGSVKYLIQVAVNAFIVDVPRYSPANKGRLLHFADRCCKGNVNQAVEVLLNAYG
jgi:hypothetical protein